MSETYTFTARSATDPGHVATFTLRGQDMTVDAGPALIETAGDLLADEGERSHGRNLGVDPWMKPAATWLMQQVHQPFSVSDVDARAPDDGLQVRAWLRVAARRLAPITFRWQEVDNPDAAGAFASEVQHRKNDAVNPGRYPGPLDYWVGWFAIAAVVCVALIAVARFFFGGNGDVAETAETVSAS